MKLSIDSDEELQKILNESSEEFESRKDGYGLFEIMRDTLLWSEETNTRVDTSLGQIGMYYLGCNFMPSKSTFND